MPCCLVHHRVADLQFGKVAQPAFEVGAAGVALAAPRTAGCGGVQLVFGDDGDVASSTKPPDSGPTPSMKRSPAARKPASKSVAGRPAAAVFGEVVGRVSRRPGDSASSSTRPRSGRGSRARTPAGRPPCGPPPAAAALPAAACRQRRAPCARGSALAATRTARRAGTGRPAAGRGASDRHPASCGGFACRARTRRIAAARRRASAQRGILRQVVEQRAGALEEQRQVVLDAGRQDAVGHILVQRDARGIALEGFAEALAEHRAAGLVAGGNSRAGSRRISGTG
jgi:hypothetical protein